MSDRVGQPAAPNIYPVIQYHDAKAGIAWLESALGFSRISCFEDDDGRVMHAELKLGPGIVMINSRRAPNETERYPVGSGQTIYIAISDVDAHHARAVEAGAEIVQPPFDTPYGSRDYAARDPEGNVWSFGTYQPVPWAESD